MKILAFFLFNYFSIAAFAQAEFIQTQLMDSESNEIVIDEQYITGLELEEPVFSSKKQGRNIASLATEETNEETNKHANDTLGQLVVLKEIPYSYPWHSHTQIEEEALAEFEAEQKKK